MRKLTEQDIEKELADIARWPSPRSWIFMKNLYDGRTGWVLSKMHRDNKPISLSLHPDAREAGAPPPDEVFAPSLRDLIAAGWVVD